MGSINTDFKEIITMLEASAREAQTYAENQAERNRVTAQQKQEAAILSSSSSGTKEKDAACESDCKYKILRQKFSPELLSKLMEYNLNPADFSPIEAVKKLLTLGMPIEYVVLDLQRNGTDINGVSGMLSQKGLSGFLNTAITKGLNERSTASAIAFANGLGEAAKPAPGQNLSRIS